MLTINSIKNVKYTLNSQPSFTSGERSNYGVSYNPKPNFVERNFWTAFAGMIEEHFAFLNPKAAKRAESIEKGIEETKKLNKVA